VAGSFTPDAMRCGEVLCGMLRRFCCVLKDAAQQRNEKRNASGVNEPLAAGSYP